MNYKAWHKQLVVLVEAERRAWDRFEKSPGYPIREGQASADVTEAHNAVKSHMEKRPNEAERSNPPELQIAEIVRRIKKKRDAVTSMDSYWVAYRNTLDEALFIIAVVHDQLNTRKRHKRRMPGRFHPDDVEEK